jgi:hypothetical protein
VVPGKSDSILIRVGTTESEEKFVEVARGVLSQLFPKSCANFSSERGSREG